jgi:hypothetical protein
MSHEQATRLLAHIREGASYPLWMVDLALELTGDLEGA